MNSGFFNILAKEFGGYFRTNLAYFILAVYTIFSLALTFYGSSFFELPNQELFSLFYLQPQILSVLIPAVTMRLWAEEKKSGTIEFLLTQPLKPLPIVLAKFTAGAIFGLLMLSMTFPLWFYTSMLTVLDNSNIICAYFGCFLVMLSLCAVGCAVSCANKNPIAAYMLSLVICWMLSSITDIPGLSFSTNYLEFVSGQMGASSIIYFSSIIMLALLINFFLMHYKNKHLSLFFAFLVAFIFLNLSSYTLLGSSKLDLTASKKYSLSEKSLQIVSQMQIPVNIKLFVSENIEKDTEYAYYLRYVLGFLNKYKSASDGKIQIQLIKTTPYSVNEEEAAAYRIVPIGESKTVFGLVVEDYEHNFYTVPFLNPEQRGLLEKNISRDIYNLNNNRAKIVGIMASKAFSLTALSEKLNETYSIMHLPNEIKEVPLELDSLILINPQGISTASVYAIDQFLMRGGNVLAFLDENTPKAIGVVPPSSKRFDDLINNLGISYIPESSDDEVVSAKALDFPYPVYASSFGSFEAKDNEVFILYNNKFLGIKTQKELKSVFDLPLFESENLPFLNTSIKNPLVIMVADADLLNIPANMDFAEYLTDLINENDILIKDSSVILNSTIGENIKYFMIEKYSSQYDDIQRKIEEVSVNLDHEVESNIASISVVQNIEKMQNELNSLIGEMAYLEYQVQKDQKDAINDIIYTNFFLPAMLILAIFCLDILLRKRKRKKAQELIK